MNVQETGHKGPEPGTEALTQDRSFCTSCPGHIVSIKQK